MITVISGSNRKNNKTFYFANFAFKELQKQTNKEVRFLDFSTLEGSLVNDIMYKDSNQPELIKNIQDDYFLPASKFWFFIPEYNGSYPGVVKLILDVMSVREITNTFNEKKACITGIASGRAGNLRGMDHLADVLNHLGVLVHPNKNPISSIYKLIDSESKEVTKETSAVLQSQVLEFLKF